MNVEIPKVLQAVLEDYALPLDGIHGVAHWARVLENGRRLASETGANIEVVSLFASYTTHGELTKEAIPTTAYVLLSSLADIRGKVFDLEDETFVSAAASLPGTHA